jgi:ATP-dependent Clp protease ATP-binding subunit ClpC
MRNIVQILLSQVRDRLRLQEIELDIAQEAVDLLIDRGFDPSLGARPLKRAIQKLLEDPFAEFILRRQFSAGARIRVERKNDQLDFQSAPVPEPAPPAAVPRA